MPIQATGTSLSNQIAFNTGSFDINGFEFGQVQDITITLAYSQKELYQLGSILMSTAPKRYNFKPSAKFKLKSLNKEMYSLFLGSSGPDGQGFDYTLLDGQNVLTRATINCIMNDDPTKTVQFQFTNAMLASSLGVNLKMEDFSEVDVEIEAQNVTIVTNF